jgi:hypothetical protein
MNANLQYGRTWGKLTLVEQAAYIRVSKTVAGRKKENGDPNPGTLEQAARLLSLDPDEFRKYRGQARNAVEEIEKESHPNMPAEQFAEHMEKAFPKFARGKQAGVESEKKVARRTGLEKLLGLPEGEFEKRSKEPVIVAKTTE